MPKHRADVLLFPGVEAEPSMESIDILREAVAANLKTMVVIGFDTEGVLYVDMPIKMTKAEFDDLIRESQVYSATAFTKKPKGGGKSGKKK